MVADDSTAALNCVCSSCLDRWIYSVDVDAHHFLLLFSFTQMKAADLGKEEEWMQKKTNGAALKLGLSSLSFLVKLL